MNGIGDWAVRHRNKSLHPREYGGGHMGGGTLHHLRAMSIMRMCSLYSPTQAHSVISNAGVLHVANSGRCSGAEMACIPILEVEIDGDLALLHAAIEMCRCSCLPNYSFKVECRYRE